MPTKTRVVTPVPDPRYVRDEDGTILKLPEGWVRLPPGDAGLTRRVKAAGPSWTVQEKVGRKLFSRGVWAPAANIERARVSVEQDRSDPAYAQRLEKAAARREVVQERYVETFEQSVLAYLAFSPTFAAQGVMMARRVAAHATPVGSGTVARTQRIPVAERAAAAVIAWMRHQTTAYDDLRIERVKGARREVRRDLAAESKRVLAAHRVERPHPATGCPLCTALAKAEAPQPADGG